MYIREIILEGFKSYATRTVIGPWDPTFNAITGLNGSGKSNILDAICFVLGIDNLKQVRVASLQDLIYKRGAGGVSRASVTIVFDNVAQEDSPTGYSDCPTITVCRQVMVGGKTKYLLNGHQVTQKKVDDMFQSVQLNVNNPHFLIMQGQITKVLNQRPQETLAMLEEAAGTRMYEERRQKAALTMDRKDEKIAEIEGQLDTFIEPRLRALKADRQAYVEFKRVEGDLLETQKYLAAADYYTCMQRMVQLGKDAEEQATRMHTAQKDLQDTQDALERAHREKQSIEQKRKASGHAGENAEHEARAREAMQSCAQLEAQLAAKRGACEQETSLMSRLKGQLVALQKSIQASQEQAARLQQEHSESTVRHQEHKAEQERQAEVLRSLTTGIAQSSSLLGYEGLMAELQAEESSLATEIQQDRLHLEQLLGERGALAGQLQPAQHKAHSQLRGIASLEAQLADKQAQLATQNTATIDAQELTVMRAEGRQAEHRLRRLQDTVGCLQGDLGHVLLNAISGKPGVHGVVAELLQVNPGASESIQALEIVAGGRLFNVNQTNKP